MENTTLTPPTQQQDDILTPSDSLEAPQQPSAAPYQPPAQDGSGSGQVPSQATVAAAAAPTAGSAAAPAVADPASLEAPQTVANEATATTAPQESATVTDLGDQEFVQSRSSLFSNRLFRRVAIASGVLLALIAVMVGITALTKRVNNWTATPAEQIAQIKEQSVDLKNKLPANASSKLQVRDGVFTFAVDGDIATTGQVRFVGVAGVGQLSTVNLTENRTYLLPDLSGTICLDSGNCNFVTAAQLAALGVDVAAVSAVTGSGQQAQTSGNSGVQTFNGMIGAINLQGTANQVLITDANGTVTLALPQDIGLDSTPTFGGITLNGTGVQNGFQLCDDSNNCGFARGDLAILQGGNAYATDIIVGAYDNHGLTFITNNTQRMNITNNGSITIGGSTADRIRVLAEFTGSTPLVFQGATDNFFRTTLVVTDPTANRNIILPNADGTICLTSGNCSGAGGYGDILNGGNTFNAAIAIGTNDNYGISLKTFNQTRLNITNTGAISLLGDTAINANVSLGASSASRITLLGQILGGTPLVFQGATNDSFATSFVISDPTANRTIVFPNADGTVCLTSGNCAGMGGSGDILQGGNNFTATMVLGTNDDFGFDLKTNNIPRLSISNVGNATFSADVVVNGSTTLGDTSADRVRINGQILGNIPFVFQGATDNAFATFFTVADPTSNRNIILPNADGTICLSSGNCTTSGGAGDVNNGGNSYNSNMSIGTNDNFSLTLKTDNTDRITISNTGLTTILANFIVNGDTFLGASSSNALTLQGSDLFAPNNLNIDTYTQYIDTLNNTVGFGMIPDGSARVNVLAINGGDALTVNNGGSVGNILNLQDNGVNVVTVANNGYTTFKNSVDDVAAFQIQNAIGNTILNADTTTRTISVNGGPSTYGYLAPGPLFADGAAGGLSNNATVYTGAVDDFNNDGWADIAYTNDHQAGVLRVHLNTANGSGSFAAVVNYPLGVDIGSTGGRVVSADFNSDGYKDLAMRVEVGGLPYLRIMYNNGNGTFGAPVNHAGNPGAVVGIADLNNDGYSDIVGVTSTSYCVTLSDGLGGFTMLPCVDTGATSVSLKIADINNDGNQDIIIANLMFRVRLGNGDGTFGSVTNYNVSPSVSAFDQALTVKDFNGDGWLDLAAVINSSTPGSLVVVFNNGAGNFSGATAYTTSGNARSITSADFNDDGFLDIAFGAYSGSTQGGVILNNGNGTFGEPIKFMEPSMNDNHQVVADFNHDGKPDVISFGNNKFFQVYLGAGGTITVKNSLSVSTATVNDTALYVKPLVGQVADIVRVDRPNGSTAMFSLSATGAALFRNSIDSSTGLQIQNAAGTNLFVADTAGSRITIGNSYVSALGAWTTSANNLPGSSNITTAASYNSYGYALAAYGGTAVYYTALNSNGTTGAWATNPNPLPVGLHQPAVVTNNGYIYVMGGATTNETDGNSVNTVYYAVLNPDGTTGAWNTTSTLPANRFYGGGVTHNNYMYYVGGGASGVNTVYYAQINGNGTTGAWAATTALPETRTRASVVASAGYIYVLGGLGGGGTDQRVYSAPLNGDGTVGTWTAQTSLPEAYTRQAAAVISNGFINFIGGYNGSANTQSVYTAPVSGGVVGSWAAGGLLPQGTYNGGAFTANGYVYAMRGQNTNTVYYTRLPGINTGASFTEGQTTINSNLAVQGADNTLLSANLGTNTLTVTGSSVFKSLINTATAFQIQNASGNTILNADTINRSININGAPSTYSFTPPGPLLGTPTYNTIGTGSGGNSVATGRINGDAFPDIVVVNRNANTISVFLNNGNGTFAPKVDYNTSVNSPESVVVADLNGDGRDDVAVGHYYNGFMRVFINNNDVGGTLAAGVDYAGGARIHGIAAVDLNGDNRPDLVGSYFTGVSVWMNNGNGTFAPKVDYAIPSSSTGNSVAGADINNDGFNDVIVGSNTHLYVYPGNGTGALGTRADYPKAGAPGGIAVADLNGDNYKDVVIGQAGGNIAEVFLNNGNGTFAAKVGYVATPTSNVYGVFTSDLNGDGFKDITAVSNYLGTYTVSVLLGYGNGTFAPKVDYAISNPSLSVTGADFNLDGKQDIAAAGESLVVMLGLGSVTTVRSSLSVASSAAVDTALFVKGTTGQTADLLRVADGNGAYVFNVAANGAVLFGNSTDSTSAFKIQNAGGTSQLQVDTTNSRVQIGNVTADGLATLLVLDTKNTAGDPTGVNGAMYYNSNLGKFRCYEAGVWGNCVGGAGAGAILQDGNSFGAPITIGTIDNYEFNFKTHDNIVATLGTDGSALFKNSANSDTGFQIQNAGGGSMLTVSTLNNVVVIGDMPSATPTLLMLGNGSDVTDPTGYDGTMYYNNAINRFRCYENGGWKNCITAGGGGGGGDILNGGNSGLGNMVIGNIDAGMLDLITANQVRLRIGSAGNVMINSVGTAGTVEKLRVNTPTTVDNAAATILATGGAANKGLVIQGSASQTANLQEWQTSTGQLRAAILASGEFRIYDPAGTDSMRFIPAANGSLTVTSTHASSILSLNPDGALNLGTGSTNAITMGRSGGDGGLNIRANTIITATASTVVLRVKAASAQTADIQQWLDSGNNAMARVTAAGVLQVNSVGTAGTVEKFRVNTPTTVDNSAVTILSANTATDKVLVIQGAASQSNYLTQWQSSTGTSLAYVNSSGSFVTTSSILATNSNSAGVFGGSGAITVGGQAARLSVYAANSGIGSVGLAIRGGSAQTANLQEWQDNSGNVLNSITATGNMLFGADANRSISVAAATTLNAAGANLTVQAGAANGTGTGGVLNLVGGAVGSGSNVSGGVNISTSGAFGQSGSINLTTSDAGVAAGSINLQAGKNNSNAYSAINIAASGGRVNIGATTNSAKLSINNSGGSVTDSVLLVLGATGQTGALQAWASATNGLVGGVSDAGRLTFLEIYQGANQVCDTSGNCGSSLQDAYNGSTNPEIVLGSAANAGLTIRDNATPIAGNLFEIQNNAGTVTYFKVDASGIDIPTGSLKVGGIDRIDNSGTLLNVTYNGNTIGTQYGGTGASSFTANGLLFGNGTGALQSVSVGSSGQCLLGNTAAAPTWGSCTPGGSGNVNQGGNSFGMGMTIGTTDNFGVTLIADNHAALVFDDEARATFQNKSDSTAGFQVQNAAGTNLFSIDSTNSRIYVGNAMPDSVGVLLVLDTKNTAGDPAGVDGGMYYNSNLGKFRCYENSEWKDCIYNMKTANKTADQTFSSTSYAGVNDLSFGVVAGRAYRLQCSLLLSVPSGTSGGNVSTLGPASPAQYTATFLKSVDQSSGDNYATSSTYDDGSSATTFRVNTISTGANRFIVSYNAVIINGPNSGTWQLRAKAVDGASSITFYANSSCNMQPL